MSEAPLTRISRFVSEDPWIWLALPILAAIGAAAHEGVHLGASWAIGASHDRLTAGDPLPPYPGPDHARLVLAIAALVPTVGAATLTLGAATAGLFLLKPGPLSRLLWAAGLAIPAADLSWSAARTFSGDPAGDWAILYEVPGAPLAAALTFALYMSAVAESAYQVHKRAWTEPVGGGVFVAGWLLWLGLPWAGAVAIRAIGL